MAVLQVAVIGLAQSGAIAMLAVGLVLIYRTTGVVNLAHWSIGLLGVVTYVLLTQGSAAPNALAAVAGVAVASSSGALAQRIVFSRARRGDAVTMILLALGVGTFLAAVAEMLLRAQQGDIVIEPFIPARDFAVGGTVVTLSELVTLAAAAAAGTILVRWLKHSRSGQAMRAVAQNREAAQLAGIDAARYGRLAWFIGSGLAACALLLVVPHSAGGRGGILSTAHLVPLGVWLIPAFGAALVGGLVSIPAALAGSLVFGLGQELMILAPTPVADRRGLLAFVVITILLLLRTERFFARQSELDALRS